MKTKVFFPACALLAALNLAPSCLAPVPAAVEPAVLRLSLAPDGESITSTKATADPFDTGSYILSITSSEGKTVFQGLWGSRPDKFELEPGSYAISMLSTPFKEPEYDCPQFGDTRSLTLTEADITPTVTSGGGIQYAYKQVTVFNRQDPTITIKKYSSKDTAAKRTQMSGAEFAVRNAGFRLW